MNVLSQLMYFVLASLKRILFLYLTISGQHLPTLINLPTKHKEIQLNSKSRNTSWQNQPKPEFYSFEWNVNKELQINFKGISLVNNSSFYFSSMQPWAFHFYLPLISTLLALPILYLTHPFSFLSNEFHTETTDNKEGTRWDTMCHFQKW